MVSCSDQTMGGNQSLQNYNTTSAVTLLFLLSQKNFSSAGTFWINGHFPVTNICDTTFNTQCILPPASEGGGRYYFHRCLYVHTRRGGGTPSQFHNTSTGPWPGIEYPPARDGVPSAPPPDRTAEGVFATRRAVCLLRSGRRTFLLPVIFGYRIFTVKINKSRYKVYSCRFVYSTKRNKLLIHDLPNS